MNTADKLKALREAATPRPWTTPEYAHLEIWAPSKRFRDARTVVCLMPEADGPGRHHTDPDGFADAALIVALVNAAPALEALVRAAEKVTERPGSYDSGGSQWWADHDALAAALAELGNVL